MRRVFLVAMTLAVLLTCGAPQPVRADPEYGVELGWGMAAIGVNIFYMPAKVAYATIGGVVGTLSYAVTGGGLDAAQKVWSPTLGGTYVLTPEMLRGEAPILFAGETYG